MQEALTALMFNWYAQVYRASLTPWPELIPIPSFPPVSFVPDRASGPFPQPSVSVPGALIGSWTA
jgi:hypothetical protein